jgi:prepilin-type N-terminal cleavage/methylation domain-containing protein
MVTKSQDGLSLVELITVVIIVAVLIAIAVLIYNSIK